MYVKFWRPGGKALWQGCKVLRQDRKIAMVITLVAMAQIIWSTRRLVKVLLLRCLVEQKIWAIVLSIW